MSRLLAVLGLVAVFVTALYSEEVEVIVTASRIEEEAKSSPVFVRVIPEETVSRGATVLDAIGTLADVAIRESSPGKAYVSMGGFGENGFGRTLILLDGRPINRPDMASVNWSTIPLDRVLRIEVVKGPMSSQYGDQAIAGVINIITRDPEGFEAWVRAALKTNLSNQEAAGVAWGSDTIRAELSINHDDIRPSRDRSDSRVLSSNGTFGVTAGIVDIDTRGFVAQAGYELPGGLSEAQYLADPDQAVNQNDDVAELSYGASLGLAVSPGRFSLDMPVSWRRVNSANNMASWSSFTDSLLDDVRATLQTDASFFLGESVILIPILGVDGTWSSITYDSYTDANRDTLTSSESSSRAEIAFFARTKWMFGEKWNADGGLRFAYYQISAGSDEKQYTPFVYDVGLSRLAGESWAFSTRYGRVFRYPMLDEQASYFGFGPPGLNTDLEPEYGHHVTASAEYSTKAISASVAPYFIEMNDEILYNPTTFQNENIGDTYHYGAVVSADWQSAVVNLKVSYSYDRATFQDTGNVVPLVPAHTVYGRFGVFPFKVLELSTDARYTSSYYKGGDVENTQGVVEDRVVWDIRIDWTPVDSLDFYAAVTNILDNRTPSLVYYSSWSGESWYPSMGREFLIGATWQY